MSPLLLSAPVQRIAVAHHSGPGLRAIIWVQGCSLLCTRVCLNPHLLSRHGGVEVESSELSAAVIALQRNYRELEGLTVLGGEPFDQAEPLAEALSELRRSGLSTMVYSGHVLEELEKREDARALLRQTDILVDGPFKADEYDEELIWRGSRNQRILCLTERYSPAGLADALQSQHRSIFISVGHREILVSGAQNRATAAELRSVAAKMSGGIS